MSSEIVGSGLRVGEPGPSYSRFSDREIRFLGVHRHRDWRMKCYCIRYGAEQVDWEGFGTGIADALSTLPPVQVEEGRPGLGFVIAHRGKTGDYIVLGWWNRENELPVEVWVRRTRQDPWRKAVRGESMCAWDLEVIGEERTSWIETMLSGPLDPRAYLERVPPRLLLKENGEWSRGWATWLAGS